MAGTFGGVARPSQVLRFYVLLSAVCFLPLLVSHFFLGVRVFPTFLRLWSAVPHCFWRFDGLAVFRGPPSSGVTSHGSSTLSAQLMSILHVLTTSVEHGLATCRHDVGVRKGKSWVEIHLSSGATLSGHRSSTVMLVQPRSRKFTVCKRMAV